MTAVAPELKQGPSANIGLQLSAMARLAPDRKALVAVAGREGGKARYRSLTFGELDRLSDRLAHGLVAAGLKRGDRTVLLATPSLEFFGLVFALFKAGAVLVMVDPGIGRERMLACIAEAEPRALVGIPRAHVARLLFPRAFRSVELAITLGRRLLWGGPNLEALLALGSDAPFPAAEPAPGETAALLYTSGSTGIPKGVVYTHEIFAAQVELIRAEYGIQPGEIDLPTFPLFALFDPALGVTAVLPEMDYSAPAKADPARLVEALRDHGCTMMFGSPALLDNFGRYGKAQGLELPTLKRVLSAGAPVRNDVLERVASLLRGGAQVFTPFGATESLPVSSIGSAEVLAETAKATAAGQGVCVGRPVPGVKVRVIRISDEPIPAWAPELELPPGEVGEITVAGPVATQGYWRRPEQDALAKIREGDRFVHRMGDLGYLDAQGRLWMCGRKSQRVVTAERTLFTTPVEEVFNQHPAVRRSALVGVGPKGQQRPVVLLEREPGAALPESQLLGELAQLGAACEATRGLTELVTYPGTFPVDRRHNAKIEREKLARWAAERR